MQNYHNCKIAIFGTEPLYKRANLVQKYDTCTTKIMHWLFKIYCYGYFQMSAREGDPLSEGATTYEDTETGDLWR